MERRNFCLKSYPCHLQPGQVYAMYHDTFGMFFSEILGIKLALPCKKNKKRI